MHSCAPNKSGENHSWPYLVQFIYPQGSMYQPGLQPLWKMSSLLYTAIWVKNVNIVPSCPLLWSFWLFSLTNSKKWTCCGQQYCSRYVIKHQSLYWASVYSMLSIVKSRGEVVQWRRSIYLFMYVCMWECSCHSWCECSTPIHCVTFCFSEVKKCQVWHVLI